jgi:spore germination protein GerM
VSHFLPIGTRRGVGVALGLVTGALALSACGIPTQPSASPISARQTQNPLSVTPTTTGLCAKSECTSVDVFFVAPNGLLKPVDRLVPPHAKLSTVVGALLAGPTPQDFATGLASALGAGIHLLSAHLTGDTATLNFSVDFGTLSGTQEVRGVAQIVYTVTQLKPGVGVTFEIDGVPTKVPVESGALVTGAVHRSEYALMLTPRTQTTTTIP